MQYTVLLIYPLMLLILIFYGAKSAGRGKTAPDYLCLDQARMIRAAACIAIMLHHLSQQVTHYGSYFRGPITLLSHIGFMFTSLFFFFSGYGLITSLYGKPGYLKTFLQKRLPAILIPFWTVNLLGVLLNCFIYGAHTGAGKIISSILGLTLVNSNGWFFIEIVFLYLIFWLLFLLIPNRNIATILLCAATVLLIMYSFSLGSDLTGEKTRWFKGEWWFNSTITFVFGIVYARFKKKIDAFCKKHYPVLMGTAAVLLVIMVRFSVLAVFRYGYYRTRRDALITLAVQTGACFAFPVFVLLLNMKITVGNRVLKFLSGISMELFLIHGYFATEIFSTSRLKAPVYFAAVILCSIAASAVVSLPVKTAVKQVTAFLTREKIHNDTLEYKIRQGKKDRRNKKLKITAAACGLLCLLAGFLFFLQKTYFSRIICRKELASIQMASEGETVFWGRFETSPARPGRERLKWIVIRKEEDRACLLCEKGIAGSCYNHRHQEISWEDSDLRKLLGTEKFTGMFSRFESEKILPVDGDMLTLLTAEEAEEFFLSDRERELVITQAALSSGTNTNEMSKDNLWDMKNYRTSWWWLKGKKGEKAVTAPMVTVDGIIEKNGKEVNRVGGAVRPVVWIDLT